MRTLLMTSLLLSVACSTDFVWAQDDSDTAMPVTKLADGPMQKWQPFIGTWEIDATWSSGEPLWGRNTYSVGLGGRFVEASTFTKDENGEAYERYRTVFSHDAETDEYRSYGFTYDGTVTSIPNTVEEVDGKTIVTSQWKQDTAEIKQTVTTIDQDSYRWQVWMRTDADGDWTSLMDGTWKRVKTPT